MTTEDSWCFGIYNIFVIISFTEKSWKFSKHQLFSCWMDGRSKQSKWSPTTSHSLCTFLSCLNQLFPVKTSLNHIVIRWKFIRFAIILDMRIDNRDNWNGKWFPVDPRQPKLFDKSSTENAYEGRIAMGVLDSECDDVKVINLIVSQFFQHDFKSCSSSDKFVPWFRSKKFITSRSLLMYSKSIWIQIKLNNTSVNTRVYDSTRIFCKFTWKKTQMQQEMIKLFFLQGTAQMYEWIDWIWW